MIRRRAIARATNNRYAHKSFPAGENPRLSSLSRRRSDLMARYFTNGLYRESADPVVTKKQKKTVGREKRKNTGEHDTLLASIFRDIIFTTRSARAHEIARADKSPARFTRITHFNRNFIAVSCLDGAHSSVPGNYPGNTYTRCAAHRLCYVGRRERERKGYNIVYAGPSCG